MLPRASVRVPPVNLPDRNFYMCECWLTSPCTLLVMKSHGRRPDDVVDSLAVFGSRATSTSPVDLEATVDLRLLRQNQSSGFAPCASACRFGHESDDVDATAVHETAARTHANGAVRSIGGAWQADERHHQTMDSAFVVTRMNCLT